MQYMLCYFFHLNFGVDRVYKSSDPVLFIFFHSHRKQLHISIKKKRHKIQ